MPPWHATEVQRTAPPPLSGARTGPGGRPGERGGRPRADRAHPGQSGGGGAAVDAAARHALRASVRCDRSLLAGRVQRRICLAPVGGGRARAAPASFRHARAPEIRAEPGRPGRSRRRAAVLAGAGGAGRFARGAGVPHRALLQDHALFAGHALAARRALPRAARAVRLPGDHVRHRAGRRPRSCISPKAGAARQARHHSAGAVVGDRHARHHRLWRRGAGHRARQADRYRRPSCSAWW